MKCRHARKTIAEHLAREERELPSELEAHVADCAQCGRLWREQIRIHSALTDVGTTPAPPPPADLAQRARRRLLGGERTPPAPLRVVLVYGALAAVVIIGAIALFAGRARAPGGPGADVAQAIKERVAPEQPGGTGGSPPVRSQPTEEAPVDPGPVLHKKATSPGDTRSSPSVHSRPTEEAPVDERLDVPDTDEVDLLIIVWAPPAVTREEQPPPEDQWVPHTELLSPMSDDVVARATQVASAEPPLYPSAEPSVEPVRSAVFAALPVQSMDFVAQLTSVQAEAELPETESPPDPAPSDVTTEPESATMIVDGMPSGGEDDAQPCEPEILLCIDAGDDHLLLCGELGVGGGGLA